MIIILQTVIIVYIKNPVFRENARIFRPKRLLRASPRLFFFIHGSKIFINSVGDYLFNITYKSVLKPLQCGFGGRLYCERRKPMCFRKINPCLQEYRLTTRVTL